MVRGVRFACERCGGHHFGSYQQPPLIGSKLSDGLIRYCHGSGCRHQFPAEVDYRNFTVEGKRLPTQAAYEALVYRKEPR